MPKARIRPPKKLKARVRPPAGHVRQRDQSESKPGCETPAAPVPVDQPELNDQSGREHQPTHIDVHFRLHVTPEMVVQQAQGVTQQTETVQPSSNESSS